jgi:rhodanese-related sulfurtransferase
MVNTVSPVEVEKLRAGGRNLDLIDVRTPGEYEQIHAEGARLVPLDRLDPRAVIATRTAAPDEPIYVICRSGARASRACAAFHAAGFGNALCVEGGTDAWERAGLPVVRGQSRVISLERQVRIGAGLLVLAGVLLGWLVHPLMFGLSALVGAGLVFAGVTDWCGMGMVLARMPWNRAGGSEPVAAHVPPTAAPEPCPPQGEPCSH